MADEVVIVKVKKKDLEELIQASIDAYNMLDEINTSADQVSENVRKAISKLEEMPGDASDIIVEDEE